MNPPDRPTPDAPSPPATADVANTAPEHTAAAPEHAAQPPAAPRPPRTLRQKLIGGVGWKGWLRLAGLCVLVGAVFEAGGINPFAPDFTLGGALGALGKGILNVGSWIISAGWRPLVTGALIVLPLWLLWRFATSPFRGRD